MPNAAHIYQICYDQTSLAQCPDQFSVLYNLRNERPDWSELWPIRHFLTYKELDEEVYYGFFSPKFSAKTGWTAQRALDFVKQDRSHTQPDVFVIPTFWDQVCYFLNVFHQGEHFHPGLLDTAQRFIERLGYHTNIEKLVTHSQNSVFCNFIIAKAPFWRRWLVVANTLFAIAESSEDPLGPALRQNTRHAGIENYAMKVFLQERLVSLLLATERWNTVVANVFDNLASQRELIPFRHDLLACDAAKLAYTQTGHAQYLSIFDKIRTHIGANIHQSAALLP